MSNYIKSWTFSSFKKFNNLLQVNPPSSAVVKLASHSSIPPFQLRRCDRRTSFPKMFTSAAAESVDKSADLKVGRLTCMIQIGPV